MPSLPTVVLVHGAWLQPQNYQTYIDALQAKGFTVHCPRLPTCNGSSPPTADYLDDVACVRAVVQSLVNAGERVLLILHSYGGMVGTGAVEGLSFSERKASGLPGGVIHLLYLRAYILTPGTTLFGVVKEGGFDKVWDDHVDTAEDGSTALRDPGLLFFSGRAEKSVVDKALTTLVRFPQSVFEAPSVGSAYRIVPTTYVFTKSDYTVPQIYQENMLRRVREEGAEPKVVTYDADHSIFITMEKEMVGMALEAAHDERNMK